MCGRYTLHVKADELAKRYNIARMPHDIRENFNVSPGQSMPVVIEQDGERQLDLMQWGLIPFWAKDPRIGYKLINARDDTIFDKPMWRNVILKKRCLIPADGFYEWQKVADGTKVRKQPYYIHPKQIELFSFAGVWETWKDTSGLEHKTYSIITTEPNKEMAAIHNRMPVILHPEDEPKWLESSRVTRSDIEPLLRPLEDNGLDMYKVSSDVNSSGLNEASLIYPLDAQ